MPNNVIKWFESGCVYDYEFKGQVLLTTVKKIHNRSFRRPIGFYRQDYVELSNLQTLLLSTLYFAPF